MNFKIISYIKVKNKKVNLNIKVKNLMKINKQIITKILLQSLIIINSILITAEKICLILMKIDKIRFKIHNKINLYNNCKINNLL